MTATPTAAGNPLDIGGFLNTTFKNLLNPAGSGLSPEARQRKERYRQMISDFASSGNTDPEALLRGLSQLRTTTAKLDEQGADRNLDRTIRGVDAMLPRFDQAQGIRTNQELRRMDAETEAYGKKNNAFVSSRMPVLQQVQQGEQALSDDQLTMIDRLTGAYERNNQRFLDFEREKWEASRPSGLQKILGNLGWIAQFAAPFIG